MLWCSLCATALTVKCAVIVWTQLWAGVPGAHCGTSYSPAQASVWKYIRSRLVWEAALLLLAGLYGWNQNRNFIW